mgnify:CR=1 FL=1
MASRPIESVVGLPVWASDNHDNASDHYSLLWWNNADGTLENVPSDAYWAWGLYDSLVIVIPSLDLVVVRGGARGRRLPRQDGDNHYDVLAPLLDPIVAAARSDGSMSLFDFRRTARKVTLNGTVIVDASLNVNGGFRSAELTLED